MENEMAYARRAELLKAHGVSIYGESRIPELLAAPPEEE